MDDNLEYRITALRANHWTKVYKRYYTTIRIGGKWVVTDRYSKD